MKCFVHSTNAAIGTCVRCGKGVCRLCSIVARDQLLCRVCAETLLIDRSATKFESELRLRDPASSAAMSLLHAGLGQLYNGDIKKGLALFAGNFVLEVVNAVLGVVRFWVLMLMLIMFVWLPIYVYSIWGAYRSASNYNKNVAPKGGGIQVDGWSEYHGTYSKT